MRIYHFILIVSASIWTHCTAALHFVIIMLALLLRGIPVLSEGRLGTRSVGVEYLNYWMTVLRLFVRGLCLLGSYELKEDKWPIFLRLFLFNSLLILLIRYVDDYFIFFLLFELSILPVYYIVLGWGGFSRVEAAYGILLFTLTTGGPFIFIFRILKINSIELWGTVELEGQILVEPFIGGYTYGDDLSRETTWRFIIFGFLSKLPIFGFHQWLPLAHSSAPLPGSILLAGILIKLGILGLIRFAPVIGSDFDIFFLSAAIAIAGYWTIAGVCLVTGDIKYIVACSSVIHIRLVATICIQFENCSAQIILFTAWTHGVRSVTMFYVNNLFFKKSLTKQTLFSRKFIYSNPVLVLYSFLAVISSLGVPPYGSIVSEILALSFTLLWWADAICYLIVGILVAGCFHLLYFIISRRGRKTFSRLASNLTLLEHIICIGLVIGNFTVNILAEILSG